MAVGRAETSMRTISVILIVGNIVLALVAAGLLLLSGIQIAGGSLADDSTAGISIALAYIGISILFASILNVVVGICGLKESYKAGRILAYISVASGITGMLDAISNGGSIGICVIIALFLIAPVVWLIVEHMLRSQGA